MSSNRQLPHSFQIGTCFWTRGGKTKHNVTVAGEVGGVTLTLMVGANGIANYFDKAYVSSDITSLFPKNQIKFAIVDDYISVDAAMRTQSQTVPAGDRKKL